MGLEAVMICIDNSEWSRNGDYNPSRFDSQTETANLLGGTKTGKFVLQVSLKSSKFC